MSQSATGGLGPLIDTHAHIGPRNSPLIQGATHQPFRDVTPEEFARTLDEHGVLFGVHAAASFMDRTTTTRWRHWRGFRGCVGPRSWSPRSG
jgi:predicted TIM-barrel fold metal-dependent hydrolase